MASVRLDLESRVAHMRGVKKRVHDHGRQVQAVARVRLAEHRAEGVSRVEGQAQDTDYIVSLIDDAALSIEFGREGFTRADGVYVGPMAGLRILGRSIRG
jgi:hypothetical protein